MLHRPSRLVYVRDGDVVTKSKRSKSESALLLTTEFNYQYRVHDPVWLSYKEPGDDAPKETPVIISGFISPHGRPEINEVNAYYLYSTKYLRDHDMDYNRLIPDEAVGDNVWVVANRPVHMTGGRVSSAWMGVPASCEAGQVRLPAQACTLAEPISGPCCCHHPAALS